VTHAITGADLRGSRGSAPHNDIRRIKPGLRRVVSRVRPLPASRTFQDFFVNPFLGPSFSSRCGTAMMGAFESCPGSRGALGERRNSIDIVSQRSFAGTSTKKAAERSQARHSSVPRQWTCRIRHVRRTMPTCLCETDGCILLAPLSGGRLVGRFLRQRSWSSGSP
jgi:hypothetical protein